MSSREDITSRCHAFIEERRKPLPTPDEFPNLVRVFLDQLTDALRADVFTPHALHQLATEHGKQFQTLGFSPAHVVYVYRGVWQVVTEIAERQAKLIAERHYRIFNEYLDEALVCAITEHARLREKTIADEAAVRLGNLAHELRNAVHVARLAFEALRLTTSAPHESPGLILGRSLRRMHGLIDRVLNEVSLTGGIKHAEPIAIGPFIDELTAAAALEAREHGVGLRVVRAEHDASIRADPMVVTSAITNLLHNAFKFTRPQGQVSLIVRDSKKNVSISVEDECGGMSEERQATLFQRFKPGEKNGLGLGLSLSRRGVEEDGGTLDFHNHPGRGCVFTVEFPKHLLD